MQIKKVPYWVRPALPEMLKPVKELASIAATAGFCVVETANGERIQHDWPLCFGERRFKPRSIHIQFDNKGVIE